MKLEQIFKGTPVTSIQLLNAENRRRKRQGELLRHPDAGSLISFSLNIAGEIKSFPLALAAFEEGLSEIRARLAPGEALHFEASETVTGPEAFFLLRSDANSVKREMAAIEESHALGRLFDMDVLDADGRSLSRSLLGLPPRSCLICGEAARVCVKNRTHSMELILWRTAQILNDYFRNKAADQAASCAVRALLYEVSATPKPGLVDRNNSGSHKDMDFFTFLDSSAALIPWFRDFFCIGWDHGTEDDRQLFSRLRFAGREAEAHMFQATNGVNTHKGLVFSFAILCGALGKVCAAQDGNGPVNAGEVLSICRALGAYSLEDFEAAKTPKNGLQPETTKLHPKLRRTETPTSPANISIRPNSRQTAGERCHAAYGLTGARGEAAAGFPSALSFGLPALKKWLHRGFSLNDASVLALLSMLSQVDDTNMIHRGGREAALESKKEAGALLAEITPASFKDKLQALDASFIRRNLSPGGCADLLAVSLMFYFLESCGMVTPWDAK